MREKYPSLSEEEHPFVFPKDPEQVLKQLIFILESLQDIGYTLSVICPYDFVFRDKVLWLNKDTHVVELHKISTVSTPPSKCFLSEGKTGIEATYASVGLFAFYLWTRKKKTELTDEDYGKLKGTKIYYFIRNTFETNPILLYL